VSVNVYVPLPLSVAAQLDAHEDGKVPSVVDSVMLLPPVERLLPAASFACTVMLVVLEPSAVIDAGLAAIVDVAVEIGPTVTENVLVGVVSPPPCFAAWIVTEPATFPATASDATPEAAVLVPSPVTDPAPAVCEKTTIVALSLVRMLPPASSTAAVSVFVDPDATELVPEVKTS
jgi:hypothetical protein